MLRASSMISPFNMPSVKSPDLSTFRVNVRPIRASSVYERPSKVAKPSSESESTTKLPILEVPGNYGLPFFGSIKDRLDYFYFQGKTKFFKSRVQKYNSTVFRVNMPPGPFIADNPNVVVLLDGKSFPVLFDMNKVDKTDVFAGTFMPSTDLTGGYRVLAYQDPSEPKHSKIKSLIFSILKSSRDRVIPEFHAAYTELFEKLEAELASKNGAEFTDASEVAAFRFLSSSLFGVNPADTNLGEDASKLIGKWVFFNIHPILSLGLPMLLEDPLLHTLRLPSFLVKSDYSRLYDFFFEASGNFLDEAEKLGISREEACHNILYAICFNGFGGFKLLFPNMLNNIGQAGVQLHNQLAREIRSVIRSNGGKLTMAAIDKMPLTKSVVYESLRIEPPVPAQYGRAKRDLLVESHDAAFRIRAGELIFGYQPFATRDSRIFERAEEFVADRFVGEDGERLLKHLLWSNGPETEKSTAENKQCAGKDMVMVMARLFVIELFRRYDTFEVTAKKAALGSSVALTSLTKASF